MLVIEKQTVENLMKYLMAKPVQEVAGLLVFNEKDGQISVSIRGIAEHDKKPTELKEVK
jgi:hypothetical protein